MAIFEAQEDDPLEDFERFEYEAGGKTRPVYRAGTGPAVIVIAEVPGITPRVADFARRCVRAGFTAFMPHLFGKPGKAPSTGAMLRVMGWSCISRDFTVFATGKSSPIVDWLRALAREVHAECGGPGVGVVGMCLTGNFALAMAVEPAVMAPVLSQPSLPLGLTGKQRRAVHASPGELEAVKGRCAEEGLEVVGLRFTCDKLVPAERFARLREELGDAFVGVEIDSSKGNAFGIRKQAHSVLTEDLVDEPGHPTREALDTVMDLFSRKLSVARGAEAG